MKETVAIVGMLVVAHTGLMLLFVASPKTTGVSRGFFLPSLLAAWIGYALYEGIYIRHYCPGDCAIRTDMLYRSLSRNRDHLLARILREDAQSRQEAGGQPTVAELIVDSGLTRSGL